MEETSRMKRETEGKAYLLQNPAYARPTASFLQ